MRSVSILLVAITAINFNQLAQAAEPPRPNVLWITSEDNGPLLGCYGDSYATTPNLDRLAERATLYLNCWSNAPVCAPARTAIISGMYPTSTGSEHMRSMVRLPAAMQMLPQFLRQAGYYCTNNAKEDYNLEKPAAVWDESSAKAHWSNRKPGQPFFAVFNIVVTHESQIRARPHQAVHDPDKVRVPLYHPDMPEVRQDWAQYYDKMTEMDAIAGQRLRELEAAGLADDTIVFYFGDHGPGMPRSKRWPYNSGLHVPLVVYIPDKFRHLASQDYSPGAKSARLVSFVDLAPTLVSLIGVRPPDYLQGRAFLGPFEDSPHEFLHGFRGRMDERYDMVRTARDQRYVYVRNYMPHLIYGQHVAYMFQTPTTRVWKRLFDKGQLNPVQSSFWRPKSPEELYDLASDPDETNNLAASGEHRAILERLRRAQRAHVLAIRDVGFLPEAEIHSRSRASTPYEMGHDDQQYPLERIMHAAELASSTTEGALAELAQSRGDRDSAVRYWSAMGMLMRGERAVLSHREQMQAALRDPAPSVCAASAEALGRYGDDADLEAALSALAGLCSRDDCSLYVVMHALNVLDALGDKAAPIATQIKKQWQAAPTISPRLREYVPRLFEAIAASNQHP